MRGCTSRRPRWHADRPATGSASQSCPPGCARYPGWALHSGTTATAQCCRSRCSRHPPVQAASTQGSMLSDSPQGQGTPVRVSVMAWIHYSSVGSHLRSPSVKHSPRALVFQDIAIEGEAPFVRNLTTLQLTHRIEWNVHAEVNMGQYGYMDMCVGGENRWISMGSCVKYYRRRDAANA